MANVDKVILSVAAVLAADGLEDVDAFIGVETKSTETLEEFKPIAISHITRSSKAELTQNPRNLELCTHSISRFFQSRVLLDQGLTDQWCAMINVENLLELDSGVLNKIAERLRNCCKFAIQMQACILPVATVMQVYESQYLPTDFEKTNAFWTFRLQVCDAIALM